MELLHAMKTMQAAKWLRVVDQVPGGRICSQASTPLHPKVRTLLRSVWSTLVHRGSDRVRCVADNCVTCTVFGRSGLLILLNSHRNATQIYETDTAFATLHLCFRIGAHSRLRIGLLGGSKGLNSGDNLWKRLSKARMLIETTRTHGHSGEVIPEGQLGPRDGRTATARRTRGPEGQETRHSHRDTGQARGELLFSSVQIGASKELDRSVGRTSLITRKL